MKRHSSLSTRLALVTFSLQLCLAALICAPDTFATRELQPQGLAARSTQGPITIAVDATEAARKILHARLTIPTKPGPLTLLYPKWIPGEHGPTGPITDLAGLKFTGSGKTIAWRRDDVEMYAFHLVIPNGVSSIEATLDFLLPAGTEGFSSAASATANLVVLSWNQVLLYPEGYGSDDLVYDASLHLPSGWQFGTALPLDMGARVSRNGGTLDFRPVSLTTLVDSPVIAGSHFRTIRLTESTAPSFQIDMVSDSEAALQMSPEQIANYKQLVLEANALFGASTKRCEKPVRIWYRTSLFIHGMANIAGRQDWPRLIMSSQ